MPNKDKTGPSNGVKGPKKGGGGKGHVPGKGIGNEKGGKKGNC